MANKCLLVLVLVLTWRSKVGEGKQLAKFYNLEETGLELNDYVQRLSLVSSGCSKSRCSEICAKNDSCSASEFDMENFICTMISCTEIPVQKKKNTTLHLKSILFCLKYTLAKFSF